MRIDEFGSGGGFGGDRAVQRGLDPHHPVGLLNRHRTTTLLAAGVVAVDLDLVTGAGLGQILGQDLHPNLQWRQAHWLNSPLFTAAAKLLQLGRPTLLPVLLAVASALGGSRALALPLC